MTQSISTFSNAYCGPREPSQKAPIIAVGDAFNSETLARARGLFPCRDWDAAEYRYPIALHDLACNLRITGQKWRWRSDGSAWVRGRVTWVGDGEPSTETGCWIRLW